MVRLFSIKSGMALGTRGNYWWSAWDWVCCGAMVRDNSFLAMASVPSGGLETTGTDEVHCRWFLDARMAHLYSAPSLQAIAGGLPRMSPRKRSFPTSPPSGQHLGPDALDLRGDCAAGLRAGFPAPISGRSFL